MPTDIKNNLKQVRRRITVAAKRAGRDPNEIKLIAVSKMHPEKLIRQAIDADVLLFGENKVQEAEDKIPKFTPRTVGWHLIGHLQKNKARKAVQLFDVVHSLDSPELLHRLERICEEESRPMLPVLVQVDLGGEATKYGIKETKLPLLVEALKRTKHLQFIGLMTMPPFSEDPEETRPYFQRLRDIRDRLARENVFANGFGELSMGMSHDFEVAIEEGATMLRIGTAIFGERKGG